MSTAPSINCPETSFSTDNGTPTSVIVNNRDGGIELLQIQTMDVTSSLIDWIQSYFTYGRPFPRTCLVCRASHRSFIVKPEDISLCRSGAVHRLSTEGEIKVCTWLREISSCSCLTVLPGPAWVLLSKTNKPLFPPLYNVE